MEADRSTAVRDFRQARRRAGLERLLARLTGRSLDLLSFEEVRRKLRTGNMAARGLQEIPLDAIVGSVSRYRDFTRSFLPLSDSSESRWAGVKVAQVTKGTPPITVYKVGDAYFVLDGNHRVSVARQMGLKTIEAYVTEVRTPVPLDPDVQPDDLIIKAEYANFLVQTGLFRLRPQADLTLTVPGRYAALLEHIQVHQYYLGLEQQRDVPYEEAVASWYDNVYRPVAELIEESGILRDFPERTVADLYLWLAEHRAAVEEALGWEVRPAQAIADLHEKVTDYKPLFLMNQVLRVGEPSAPAVPTRWQIDRLVARPDEQLFQNILVPLPPDETKWLALDQATLVAQREYGKLHGLYAVSNPLQKHWLTTSALRDAFKHRCDTAAVQGDMVVETGVWMDVTANLARWVDLIVLHCNPGRGEEVRTLMRHAPGPFLLVNGTTTALEKALLVHDGLPESDAALAAAAYLAQRWQTQLTVSILAGADETAEEQQEEVRRYLDGYGVTAVYTTEAVHDPTSILQAAAEHDCDLIIIGRGEGMILSLMAERPGVATRPILVCR